MLKIGDKAPDFTLKDKNGNERELHVKKAIEVTNFENYDFNVKNCFEKEEKLLWDNKYFKVEYETINTSFTLNNANNYCIVTVIEGQIEVEGNLINKGASFIVTSMSDKVNLKGNGKIVITYSKI